MTVLLFDKVTAEAFNQSTTLTVFNLSTLNIEKMVKKFFETDQIKFVDIVDIKTTKAKYGIKEKDFFKIAEKIINKES